MKKNPLMRASSIALIALCMAFVLLLAACSSGESTTQETAPEEPTYAVQIFVDCEKNLVLSRYDVDVRVDDEKIGNIDHGGEATFEVRLTKGQHELMFEEEGNTSVDGKTSFVVEGEGDKYSYSIKCTRNQIEIETTKVEAEVQPIDMQVVSYGSVSIEVPSTWTVVDAENGKYVYPEYGGQLYLYALGFGLGQMSADEAHASYIGAIQDSEEFTVTGDAEVGKIGVADTYRNEIEYRVDDLYLRGAIELILTEDESYAIIFAIPDSSYDQHPDDVDLTLDSIKYDETVTPTPTEGSGAEGETVAEGSDVLEEQEPTPSKYEYAYARYMSSYDLYYLIDMDEMEATYFGTNDSGSMVLPCSGDLDSGLTIDYGDEGFVEHLQFKNQGDDSVVILTDASGFDWEFTKADVAEAEAVLASVG